MGTSTDVRILDLEASHVDALIACVRRCYGETYADPTFGDAGMLATALREGRLRSKVAVAGDGRVVGHLGTRVLFPGDCVAETVGGVVDPDFRGRHLLRDLGSAQMEVYREWALAGIWLFSTGAHLGTQKLIAAGSARATGVLLGHVPAGTDYREIGHDFGTARIGSIVFYQPLAPAPPLEVHLPAEYRDLLRELYGLLSFERREHPQAAVSAPGGSCQHDPSRGIVQMRFGRLAGGERREVGPLLAELQTLSAPVAYADVPLCEPGAPALVTHLRETGFHFGALLPGSERSETLRLQRLASELVAPERIVLGSPQIEALLEAVLSDRAVVGDAPR